MVYTKAYVAARIDHAVLKPTATHADLERDARMCAERGVFSICVRPCDVKPATAMLSDSRTLVGTVLGFPHGGSFTGLKALEAQRGIEDGARELDMVMNIGRFLSGDYKYVEREVVAVVRVAQEARALVKLIIETCYLTPAQIANACQLAEAAGVDYVKTSTGFGSAGATQAGVAIMLATVGDRLKVKAAGGIKTWADAVAFLDQGCARLGVGSTETVLDGGEAMGEY